MHLLMLINEFGQWRDFKNNNNLFYFGQWGDFWEVWHTILLLQEKKRKKDPMPELTIHHWGKSRYAHCSMQPHFWGPKCF